MKSICKKQNQDQTVIFQPLQRWNFSKGYITLPCIICNHSWENSTLAEFSTIFFGTVLFKAGLKQLLFIFYEQFS